MGKSASKEFSREVLKTHNDYRKKHGASGLKLCSKLCKEAQQYAEALASTQVLKHSSESSRGQCGENLAWASYDQPGKEVAERWYSEIKNYNFNCPGYSSGTGHFTAMIWKSSKKLGIGKASATDGSTFVVARYFPAGNIMNRGYFEENVLPPKKKYQTSQPNEYGHKINTSLMYDTPCCCKDLFPFGPPLIQERMKLTRPG